MVLSVLKRPLFTSCTIATVVAVVCGFLSPSVMVALAVAILFACAFVIPFKTPLKTTVMITALTCMAVIVSNILYYNFSYKPASEYDGVTASAKCEVIKTDSDKIVVLCKAITFDDVTTNSKFRANIEIDAIADKISEADIKLVPSTEVLLKVHFYKSVRRSLSDSVHIYGSAEDIQLIKQYKSTSPRYLFYNFQNRIKKAMPFKDKDTAAFINGIVFGNTDDISDKVNTRLSKIGLSHVTSVSGMHLVFSVLFVDLIMLLFAVGHKKRAVVAIIFVVLFTVISGFAVSCIRAAIMIFMYYIGIITDRMSDSLTSLSVAVFAIVLFCPQYTSSVSLMLSAAATFGIIVLSPCFDSYFKFNIKNRFVHTLVYSVVSLLTMSLSACVCCLPISATLFGEFCIISPVVNVLLTLPIQLLFYVGIIGIVLSKIPLLSTAFSFIAEALYNVIEFAIEKCYYIKNTSVTYGYRFYYILLISVCVLAIGLFVLYKTKRSVKISLIYISAFGLVCVALFVTNLITTKNTVRVHFADVGDGNCSIITKDESAVIVDCGGEYSQNIEQQLIKDNIKRIKLIAITHFDLDHIGYLGGLIDTYDVDAIVYPEFAKAGDWAELLSKASERGTKIIVAQTDDGMDIFDNARLSWYVEKAYKVKYYENVSAVYRLDVGVNSVLYTGDMNIYQEHAYIGYADAMDCDVLSVAHHGSATSSHAKFLNLCSPDYSVISAANNPESKFPSDKIVGRLEKISRVLQTSYNSTVTFKFDDKGYKLTK